MQSPIQDNVAGTDGEPRSDTDEWYADGLRFSCTQCGNCCTGPPGYVWFNEGEAQTMADRLGVSVDEFHRRFAHQINGRWSLNEVKRDGKFDCVFLQRDGSGRALCSVYDARPTQCRTWPFWTDNLATPRHWQRASRNCPGMDKGKFYPIEQIRIRRDETPD